MSFKLITDLMYFRVVRLCFAQQNKNLHDPSHLRLTLCSYNEFVNDSILPCFSHGRGYGYA